MDEASLRKMLDAVASGSLAIEMAIDQLRSFDTGDMGFARVDNHRSLRRGFPEVIFGEGKTSDQIAAIAKRIYDAGVPMLATRCTVADADAVRALLPEARYDNVSRCIVALPLPLQKFPGHVVVATGGTSDIPVAEEAALTASLAGVTVDRLWDVGVAGIHRLLENRDRFTVADVIVAVAGMEGALPSVVAGLVSCPVIAVPTSIGYGAAFGGLAPLLGMLNSCSPGVAVVNIDNGFGAGYLAGTLARQIAR